MGEALAVMQNSMKQAKGGQIVEDNVDSLIKKLEGQGKRVKIIDDDNELEEEEDVNSSSPDEKRKKRKGKGKRPK